MRDQYIGIDLHKAFFQACAVSPDGERLWEGRFPRTAAGVDALTARSFNARLRSAKSQSQLRQVVAARQHSRPPPARPSSHGWR